jgi:hypothetical protein
MLIAAMINNSDGHGAAAGAAAMNACREPLIIAACLNQASQCHRQLPP